MSMVGMFRLCLFIILVCASFSLYSKPILDFPSFNRLSTEQGLPQDTIHSMILDEKGFLWLGTENGLSRFDGYRVQNVEGQYGELKDTVINFLFQDNNQYLFINVENQGLYTLDTDTQNLSLLLQVAYKEYPELYQSVSKIIELDSTEMLVALEETVGILDRESLVFEPIFSLPESHIESEQIIRDVTLLTDVLVIATSNGVFAYHLKTKNLVSIDYLQIDDPNQDMLNSKKLYTPDDTHLWIGTVEGLYQVKTNELLKRVIENKDISPQKALVANLNIWDIKKLDDDTHYLATNDGLYTYSIAEQNIQHIFRPTDSRFYIADDDLVTIQTDQHNNLWLGTQFDGAIYWSPKTLLFSNVYRQTAQTGALSDNQVWSFHQQNEQYLWVGTNNGLNRFDLATGDIDSYLVNDDSKALYTESTIDQILEFDQDKLLLVTANGFSLFDTSTGKADELKVVSSDEDLMNFYPLGVQSDGNGKFYFITEFGWLVYDSSNQKLDQLEALNSQLDHFISYGFLEPDKQRPFKLMISMPNELWEFDTKTSQLRLIHRVSDVRRQTEVFPESYVFTEQELYINYSGLGVVVLDSETLEFIEIYDKNNGLNTSTTYGLKLTQSGDIWLSSHSGLINFDPLTKSFKTYTQTEGLLTNEFNAFASKKLIDGRLVFGSVKGFTIFQPSNFQETGVAPNVYISGSSINSDNVDYNFDHYQRLSKQLKYEDTGFTLFFSTLKYAELANTEYKVEMTGNTNLRLPISKQASVVFPKLAPGNYQIAISAKDPSTGSFGQPSYVNVNVDYFLWTHPFAIVIYVISILFVIALWLNNRNTQLREIKFAHDQTLNTKNKLSQALQATNSGTWEWNTDGTIYASDTYEKLGYHESQSPSDFYQHLELVHPDDKEKVAKHWDKLSSASQTKLDVIYRIKASNNSYQWFRDTGKLVIESGEQKRVIGTSTNITDMLAEQQRATIFGEAFKQTNDWVVFFDKNYQLVNANPSFMRAMNLEDSSSLESSFNALLNKKNVSFGKLFSVIKHIEANDRFKYEDKLVLPNNEQYYVLVNITSIDNPLDLSDSHFYLAIISDINEQKQAEQKLRKLANYDSLTGLPNRVLLNDRIEHALQTTKSKDQMIALMFLDLDRFKQVNDSLGHNIGDELLIVVSKRLLSLCESADTVARLGGDEFVIMKEGVESLSALSVFAQKVIDDIEKPIKLSNQMINISTSLGIAIYPNDAETASDLIKNADLAMYSAKDQGRGCFQLFTSELNKKVHERLYMENKLKAAHQYDQLINYYQPIVDVSRKQIVGFELLLRWQDDKIMIPPSEFIIVAEEIGLIEDITLQAIKHAAPTIKEWQSSGFTGYISINLSARHIDREVSVQRIIELVEELSIPSYSIQFEITESAIMKNYEDAQNFIQKLCDAGFRIALDDFGTGYSSLKYLKTFPIQSIKIDRSFVFDVGLDKNDEAIISAILKMAKSLNLDCIAEGIENISQLTFLSERDCLYQQGYYFSRPVPAEATFALLRGLECYSKLADHC